MFKVIYSYLIIVVLITFILVPIINAKEHSEVNGSEEVSDKVETTESNQEINEPNQQDTQVPRDLSDRAPDSIPEQILVRKPTSNPVKNSCSLKKVPKSKVEESPLASPKLESI